MSFDYKFLKSQHDNHTIFFGNSSKNYNNSSNKLIPKNKLHHYKLNRRNKVWKFKFNYNFKLITQRPYKRKYKKYIHISNSLSRIEIKSISCQHQHFNSDPLQLWAKITTIDDSTRSAASPTIIGIANGDKTSSTDGPTRLAEHFSKWGLDTTIGATLVFIPTRR